MKGNNLRPARGIVLKNIGQRLMKSLDLEDRSIHQRHHDQVTYNTAPPQEDVVHGFHLFLFSSSGHSTALKKWVGKNAITPT